MPLWHDVPPPLPSTKPTVAAGDHDIVVGRLLEVERLAEHRPMIFFCNDF
ncbi:hypothetical protein [Saccharopolyspora sp. NPDC002376]